MIPLRIRVVPELVEDIVLGQPLLHSYKRVILDNSVSGKIHFVPLESGDLVEAPLPEPSILEVEINEFKIVSSDKLEGG